MLYEYRCRECGKPYEIVETIAEMEATRDSKRCNECEGLLEKLISTPVLRTDTPDDLAHRVLEQARAPQEREGQRRLLPLRAGQRTPPLTRGGLPRAQEWRIYPAAVAALCAGRVTWREDGVPIIDADIMTDHA